MADYRELLRRAVEALPENTGANRRAVYEKARSALVSQLRAIDPPLPAREITTHRLNLEDCIREVEHEATEKLLGRYQNVEEAQEAGELETAAPADEAAIADVEDEIAAAEDELAGEPASEPEPELEPEPEPEPEPMPDEAVDEPVLVEPEPEESDAQAAVQAAIEAERNARYEAEPVEAAEEPAKAAEEPEADDRFETAVVPEPVLEPEPETGEAEEEETAPETGEAEPTDIGAPEEEIPSEPDYEPEEPDVYPEPPQEEAAPPVEEEPVEEAPLEDSAEDAAKDAVPAGEDTEAGAYGAQQSIEDIIAQAQASAPQFDQTAEEPSTEDETTPSPAEEDSTPQEEPLGDESPKVVPFAVPIAEEAEAGERRVAHFIPSSHEAEPRAAVPLVDLHGRPLGEAAAEAAQPVEQPDAQAMSSVREVDLEPGAGITNHLSDAQVTIDRAIAALDREARGDEAEGEGAEEAGAAATVSGEGTDEPEASETGRDDKPKGGGFGPLTVFLLIAILLLGGGGAAGFWAWREGYIDLDAVFAQGGTDQPTEVAEADPDPEPAFTVDEESEPEPESEPRLPATGSNTTEQVPAPNVAEDAETVPENPVTETETPSVGGTEPEVEFEERLPAEAGEPAQTEDPASGEVEIAADGPQSLLLEEQSGGTAGAVPYTGSVEWSRGTDELGNPTIEATASIPARNLDVQVLLRRNADSNLPASHLMEINFTVAESFVGGSIANLPGVLLKDEELVQGRPLTGASARIVGNSFLFALSGASEQDVENNIELLTEQAWMDLAMVYGTGRRAILTLEKGEEGQEIFEAVLSDWADLDAEAAPQQAPAEDTADEAASDTPA